MTEIPPCRDAKSAPPPENSHALSGLWNHVTHATKCVEATVQQGAAKAEDKIHQVSQDPKVRAEAAHAGQTAVRIGQGTYNGVKADGIGNGRCSQAG